MAVDRFLIVRNVHLEEKKSFDYSQKGHKNKHFRKQNYKRRAKMKKIPLTQQKRKTQK